MKKEQWFEDGRKVIRKKTEDVEPALDRAAALRSAGKTTLGGHNWHVGSIPTIVLENWIKEAGLRPDEKQEIAELIRKKLLSGEFGKFRVHEGTF